MNPAAVWRGVRNVPAPPEPWPERVEAFLSACALHAGQRERDLYEAVSLLAGGSDG